MVRALTSVIRLKICAKEKPPISQQTTAPIQACSTKTRDTASDPTPHMKATSTKARGTRIKNKDREGRSTRMVMFMRGVIIRVSQRAWDLFSG